MRHLAIYFVCPASGTRRKFITLNPTAETVEHYTRIADDIQAGGRFRSVGLVDFAEVDINTGAVGPTVDFRIITLPAGIRAVRVEGDEPTPVQGELLEVR